MTGLPVPPGVLPEKPLARCSCCGEPVDVDAASTFRKVTGWEHPRSAGGTNALALPERHDEWRCRRCIDRLRFGVAVEQETLL